MSEEDEKNYIPNKISIVARLRNLILSIFFIIGGAYNLRQNDFAVIIGGGRCCAARENRDRDKG